MRKSREKVLFFSCVLLCVCLLPISGCKSSDKTNQEESFVAESKETVISEQAPDLAGLSVDNKDITSEMLKKSIVSAGNQARIAKLLDKAARGEDIVIGTFGGSITEGMSASSTANNYSSLLVKWFRDTYPNARFKLVNAGIGSTGTLIGVHRMEQDLLQQKPDLIIFEFSCNDTLSQLEQETYESALRRALSQEKEPAVIMLFMVRQDGTSSQAVEIPIGFRYRLPMISYGNAVNQGIKDGTLKWSDLSSDAVHPNDRGHKIAADLIIHRLRAAKSMLGELSREIPALPKSDVRFTNAKLYSNKTLITTSNSGFTAKSGLYTNNALTNGWEASAVGSSMSFETESQVVTLVFKRMVMTRGAAVQVLVNGEEVKVLESDFQGGFGEYPDAVTVLNRKETDPVTVELKVIAKDGIPANSKFLLLAVLES